MKLRRKFQELGPWLLVFRTARHGLRMIRRHINTAVYARACKSCARSVRVHGAVWIQNPSRVILGEGTIIHSGGRFTTELSDANLRVGRCAQFNEDVIVDYTGGLEVGDRVLVSEEAVIYTHDHGLNPRSSPIGYSKVIDEGAWIGARVVVLPSCRRIGAGSVIGAGSIVTRDVDAWTVVAGNPARVIRKIEQQ